jgi:CO dehydrogenase maturation factor
MGATRGPGTGCACAENTVVKSLVNHLILRADETVIMDMVAGTEHIGRGTASGVNAIIIIVEPSNRSVIAARSILEFSKHMQGISCRIVGNKIRSLEDQEFIKAAFPEIPVKYFINWNQMVIRAENASVPVFDKCPEIVDTLKELVVDLEVAGGAS